MSEIINASTAEQADKISRVIRSRALPESVRNFKIEFGPDSTGDPAVTIWPIVDDDPNPPKRVLDETSRFVRETETDLVNLGLRHWPYVRFMLASQANQYFH
ncbi:MAG TPA: hypothetical protein VMU81_24700 [Acetobacteraceae bacterium]|nr:hypothetical protein [Acetobacteraceae bacterium]